MTELAERSSAQPVSPAEAKEKVKEKGQELREQTSMRLREQVEARASQASEQTQAFALSMRQAASQLRTQGQEQQGALLDQLALRAEQASEYLANTDPDELLQNAREYGRRGAETIKGKPWLVAPVGIAVGLVSAVVASRLGSQGS